jgi:hypothetical protein
MKASIREPQSSERKLFTVNQLHSLFVANLSKRM